MHSVITLHSNDFKMALSFQRALPRNIRLLKFIAPCQTASIHTLCSKPKPLAERPVSCLQCGKNWSISTPWRTQTRQFSWEGVRYIFSADFPSTAACIYVMDFVHSHTGMPWWLTITVTTLTLRTLLTLPFSVLAVKNSFQV